jgi:hypothetical protein
MGEYAIRKSDGQEIKIGTCENMYYLRYSDRNKVRPKNENNLDPNDDKVVSELRFRLPYPDEDKILPGNYEPFREDNVLLYNYAPGNTNAGTLQLHTKYGMMLNVPCYHGEKLPENTGDIKPFWNGKGPGYALKWLKFIDGVPFGVYGCIECREEWRAPLSELIPFIGGDNAPLRNRLIEWYCPDLFKDKKVP